MWKLNKSICFIMNYTFRNNKRRIIDGNDDFFTSKIFIVRPDMSISRTQNTTQSEVITNDQFETMRPKRMRPRPVLHETKVETKANYCKTETTKVISIPHWSWDLNIPAILGCGNDRAVTGLSQSALTNYCFSLFERCHMKEMQELPFVDRVLWTRCHSLQVSK